MAKAAVATKATASGDKEARAVYALELLFGVCRGAVEVGPGPEAYVYTYVYVYLFQNTYVYVTVCTGA